MKHEDSAVWSYRLQKWEATFYEDLFIYWAAGQISLLWFYIFNQNVI